MLIDQNRVWQATEERSSRTSDPRHRHMLELVTEHSKAEVAGDLGRVMATLVPEPEYHLWLDGRDSGPKGRAQVAAFYESLLGSGCGLVEAPKVRVVVDDDAIATESYVEQVFPGWAAIANGYAADDPDGYYLARYRIAVFWPFSPDGLLVGEDFYLSRDLAAYRPLDATESADASARLGETARRAAWIMADAKW